jgi:hypothetical protein
MDVHSAAAAPAATTPPVVVRQESAAQREARVEAAVDRMLPRRQFEGVWFVLFVAGFLALSAGGDSKIIGLVVVAVSGFMLVRDVRRHVRIRERAEREVAERRHVS